MSNVYTTVSSKRRRTMLKQEKPRETAAMKSKWLPSKRVKKESTSELNYYESVAFTSCQTVRP